MKLVIFAALVGACVADALPAPPNYVAPQYRYQYPQYYQDGRARTSFEGNAAVLRSESEVNEKGYHYAYDTQNGISAEESGVEANGIQAQGSYSYTGDDGQVYSVRYTAGENGFQPEGAHLPIPPPIPEEIARSLQQNARDEAAGIYDDGSYQDAKYTPAGVIAARSRYPYQDSRYPYQGSRYPYQASKYPYQDSRYSRFRNGQYY